MGEENAERAALERRISEAGWHVLRDVHAPEGYEVEFQHAPHASFVPGAEIRLCRGKDRNDAYRRFLDELAADHPAGEG